MSVRIADEKRAKREAQLAAVKSPRDAANAYVSNAIVKSSHIVRVGSFGGRKPK